MPIEKWKLEKGAKCYNCGDATIHDVEVDEFAIKIRCRDCGFSRYYSFHIIDLPRKDDYNRG
jgi:DNA-directed RNA polymerase subunit RPC12/RpoP